MTAVSLDHLHSIYTVGDDPWGFRTSPYEQAKYRATTDALLHETYVSALELGCGNGELARHVAPRCAAYTGVDAIATALGAAKAAVPGGRFVQAYLPCDLPDGDHDLILLSEVLYFLDRPGLAALADQIARRWPGAEVLVVTWLGPSGNVLEGEAALAAFVGAMAPAFTATSVALSARYRIDRLVVP